MVLVALTDAGRRLEEEASKAQQDVVCRVGLSDGSLSALRQELMNLADRVTAPVAVQGASPGRPRQGR
ncbi:hypothetical protein [Methylobacterium sp. J-026]|uniref:hypothetical protein n=1 Tax=Methylobacterium sp. J-026 TaxID=2836624 RepID=UPI001FB9B3DB|nr:hypothetical protein [Methylobacterium sp. J-026]